MQLGDAKDRIFEASSRIELHRHTHARENLRIGLPTCIYVMVSRIRERKREREGRACASTRMNIMLSVLREDHNGVRG